MPDAQSRSGSGLSHAGIMGSGREEVDPKRRHLSACGICLHALRACQFVQRSARRCGQRESWARIGFVRGAIAWTILVLIGCGLPFAFEDPLSGENPKYIAAARNIAIIAGGLIGLPIAIIGLYMRKERLQLARDENQAGKAESDSADRLVRPASYQGEPHYEIFRDSAGAWRWRLRAPSGELIDSSSEGYSTKDACLRGIELVRSSVSAPIREVPE